MEIFTIICWQQKERHKQKPVFCFDNKLWKKKKTTKHKVQQQNKTSMTVYGKKYINIPMEHAKKVYVQK